MLSKARAYTLLEEFTDFVLIDEVRDSVVLNAKDEYVKIINYELRKFKYKATRMGFDKHTDALDFLIEQFIDQKGMNETNWIRHFRRRAILAEKELELIRKRYNLDPNWRQDTFY